MLAQWFPLQFSAVNIRGRIPLADAVNTRSTATSAAATAIMKDNTLFELHSKTIRESCPAEDLTAFSISSMHAILRWRLRETTCNHSNTKNYYRVLSGYINSWNRIWIAVFTFPILFSGWTLIPKPPTCRGIE